MCEQVLCFSFQFIIVVNSINQVIEVERDKIMTRTKNRPLCTERISKFHAIVQAIAVGAAGTWLLYTKANPLTALLGFANILLYTSVYTPLKVSISSFVMMCRLYIQSTLGLEH
jgi:heme O synthase-like polyprenyltransferase